MLEAEITASGDVLVEGQHIGQLQGFRFTPDPGAAGEAARTLNAAAQKALATEIEGRAKRIHEAVDTAFVLAHDGLIRWLGEPVGRLVAGDHILRPTVRVLADDQLNGPSLELVQTRLDLWLGQHIKKLLGPLLDLEAGEGLEGMARGIAFQIAESLGVLERSRVASEMKSLEQNARSSLRKLGIRFGAYHLYLPLLLKPAPRSLAAQLWALKNGGLEGMKGLDEVPHLAASGRTSFPANAEIDKKFYLAAGFRVSGERAVRVDILERLADIIRPAINYRPGLTPGDPPPGTADRDGFVVTVGMTSLAGCSGEPFASILKSLGYAMESRKGPAITVPLLPSAPTTPVVQTSSAETATSEGEAAEGEVGDHIVSESASAETSEEATPETTEAAAETPDESQTAAAESLEPAAVTEPEPTEENSPAAEPEAVAEAPEAEAVAPSAEPAEQAAAAAVPTIAEAEGETAPTEATAEPTAEAEPVEAPMIEVWRPQRRPQHQQGARPNQRPNRDRPAGPRRDRGTPRPSQTTTPAGDAPVAAEGGTAAPVSAEARPDHRRPDQRPPRRDQPQGDVAKRFEGRPKRDGDRKPGGDRFGKPRFEGNRDRRPDRGGPPDRTFASTERPRGREKQPDPDSPFAKLAALKAQLENKGKPE